MKKIRKNIFILKKIACICIILSLVFVSTVGMARNTEVVKNLSMDDYDPLVDVQVTVDIQKIRALDKFEYPNLRIEKIDWFGDPDFYVKVYINDEEFVSDIWHDTKYVNEPQFSPTVNVPDDAEFVSIKIQLWDWNANGDKLCDIGGKWDYDGSDDIEIVYSIKTGHWWGDDYTYHLPVYGDPSGYGRANGCDDNSIYQRDLDCELWFNIYQNDFDNDTIPYWSEVNVFNTSPEVSNIGEDADNDGVPIEWENKWGHFYSSWWNEHHWFYDPYEWENHSSMDPDEDGIDNVEEYLTSQWGSDPFRKDIFVELDQMEPSPDGVESVLPEGSKELLQTAFGRYNIVYHIDDGCMGGGEMIPFMQELNRDLLRGGIYNNYFLHGDQDNWRRGVFRYGIVVYDAGYAGYNFRDGAYQISSNRVNAKIFPKTDRFRNIAYASVYMHECGHTLAIYNPGVDDDLSMNPTQPNWWKWGPYKSCMNYRYVYRLVDYSDGSRQKNDFPDWYTLDLTLFQYNDW